MSSNFHTPYNDPMFLDTPTLESPLAELDQAITDLNAGDVSITQLNLGAFNAKTISSGAITGDKTLVTVDTEASAASDDLDTISSPAAGDFMIIKIANNSRVVTIRHNGGGTGNIRTWNTLNVILSDVNKTATLVYNGTNWLVQPDETQATSFPIQAATIATGAITYTGSHMSISTEGGAGTDDLDTINGGVQGAVLYLKIPGGNLVVLKNNTGNILTPNGEDITIRSSTQFIMLIFNTGLSRWLVVNPPTLFTASNATLSTNFSFNAFTVPYKTVDGSGHPLATTTKPYFDIMPQGGRRQIRVLSAADTTLEGFGFGTLTVSGTPSNNFGAGSTTLPGSLVRYQSGGSTGNLGGVVSPFTLTSGDCIPYFRIVFRTYDSLATCRLWIGLSSAALGNVDTPHTSSASFLGLRYSTVVPDSFWQFVTSDGSATNVTSTGVAASTSNNYELLAFFNSSNVVMYFRNLTSSSYVTINTATSIPASSTVLGLNARIETRENVAKSLQIYGVALSH